ncbi:DUF551 domain-containing protein [Enterobacter hormaechei]|uniref:DUF551 domain-containing protein n=1 Tax=Enterobacter hormaechei TaxID=158836 RepID=UPI00384B0C1F
MSKITKELAQSVSDLKAGYTLGHADVAILNELARIALASLEAEPVADERAAFEAFMEGRFKDSIDRKRVKNGDQGYFAWDMIVAWIAWQGRAAMLHGADGSSPVIQDGWVDCSERMPDIGTEIFYFCQDDGLRDCGIVSSSNYSGRGDAQLYVHAEGYDLRLGVDITHWMPLPAAPQQGDSF